MFFFNIWNRYIVTFRTPCSICTTSHTAPGSFKYLQQKLFLFSLISSKEALTFWTILVPLRSDQHISSACLYFIYCTPLRLGLTCATANRARVTCRVESRDSEVRLRHVKISSRSVRRPCLRRRAKKRDQGQVCQDFSLHRSRRFSTEIAIPPSPW